jgi:MoaA/NifB/PqqE/SkfB family radical SAM enzyme
LKLPILILNPHPRCNCRCAMCDIWKTTERTEFSVEDLRHQTESLDNLGVEWVVLSGGEALMHSELFRLCQVLRSRNIRISLLSSGLLLERHAAAIAEWIDDVIVSVDGPPAIHDQIRGVQSAFALMTRGLAAIRAIKPTFPITARCTVQKRNCAHLAAAAKVAREIGLDSISFLAADLTSEAFNRAGGWPLDKTASIALQPGEIAVLEAQIEMLIRFGGDYVVESAPKLRRIVASFRAHLGMEPNVAPRCNAPWVSAVLESNGEVRPCFFHKPYGKLESGRTLADIIEGPEASAFRAQLDIAANEICRRCVCSLFIAAKEQTAV